MATRRLKTVGTRRCEFPPRDVPFRPDGRYTVSTWNHEAQRWELYRCDVPLMRLRPIIRELERHGWSGLSYLIERQPCCVTGAVSGTLEQHKPMAGKVVTSPSPADS